MAIFHCQVWLPGGKCCYILFIFTWGNGKNMEMKPPPIQIDNLHCMISGHVPRSNSHINFMRVVFCFKQSIFSNKSFHLGILDFSFFFRASWCVTSNHCPLTFWIHDHSFSEGSPRISLWWNQDLQHGAPVVSSEGHGIALEMVWNGWRLEGLWMFCWS